MDLFDTNTTFERQLFAKAARNRIPLYGVLELLPLCNLNCDMCYVHLSKQEMQSQGRLRSLDEWISLAKQMKDAGTLFLLLTGGEPLLFPQFKELYCVLKDMGMILTLNTNGTLINEEWAEFFAKNKPRRINITLYGSKNETYENLCHMKDGFDKTIRGIELLKKYKIDVKINGSLVKKNFHDRMEIIDIGEKYDIPVRIDTYMYPSVRERTTPFNFQERLDPEDAAKARVEILHREMGDELFEQYAKQTIYLAEIQDMPEALENVNTLVNCPVLDEENPTLTLTIANTGETSTSYQMPPILEVWLDDGWYVIPTTSTESKEPTWTRLEEKMAMDEAIDLTQYQIDYGAQRYRMVVRIGEHMLSAEFTFEEVFSEQMETLEEMRKEREE